MTIPVSVTIWIQEGYELPTGYINSGGSKGGDPFPVLHLGEGAQINGYSGDPVPYLRALAEVANRLADEIAGGEPTS